MTDLTSARGSESGAPPLGEIIQLMRQAHGSDLSVFDEAFLAKSLARRIEASPCDTAAAYLERLAQDGTEADALLRSLNVSYSEFFRDPLAFALIEQQLLPGLMESAKQAGSNEIRVWSAGCATGQEAWSVAMLLDELTRTQDRPMAYRIIATDLSEPDLAFASAGVYSAEAVGNVRTCQLRECFLRQGTAFAIAPRLREHVTFSVFDLLSTQSRSPATSIYGGFDLVLCSNVLLYYGLQTQGLILNKLRRSMAAGGYLVVGETERAIVERTGGFRAVAAPASVFDILNRAA